MRDDRSVLCPGTDWRTSASGWLICVTTVRVSFALWRLRAGSNGDSRPVGGTGGRNAELVEHKGQRRSASHHTTQRGQTGAWANQLPNSTQYRTIFEKKSNMISSTIFHQDNLKKRIFLSCYRDKSLVIRLMSRRICPESLNHDE